MTSDRHARAKECFLRALELPEAERLRQLESICAGDADLEREVESLLRHHADQTILQPRGRPPALGVPGEPAWRNRVTSWWSNRRVTQLVRALLRDRRRPLASIAGALLLVVAVGTWAHYQIRNAIRDLVGQQLEAVLNADALALGHWIEHWKSEARAWAGDSHVKQLASRSADGQGQTEDPSPASETARLRTELRATLAPYLREADSAAFMLLDRDGNILAASFPCVPGERLNSSDLRLFSEAFQGESQFVPPRPSSAWSLDDGKVELDRPTTWVVAPVANDRYEWIAVLALAQFADGHFAQIMTAAHVGESGETYAFNRQGLMLSESRFTRQLQQLGLIAQDGAARSMLHLFIRDPGGNLAANFRPAQPPDVWPPTLLVATALAAPKAGETGPRRGTLTEPYRDYRGISVMGAWAWLPAYDLGLASEVDVAEADAPLIYLEAIFGALLAVLAASLVATIMASVSVIRLRTEMDQARQVGQYVLEELIGTGGMGRVYLARHALLRRPTAVKIVRRDRASQANLERFEREVQLASQLTHPNTIEIYDYGRTAEHVFYYAMEYLSGLNLSELIAHEKTIPAGRVVNILKQTCGSLGEAHAGGLVHRDIKPQNIMLCERGGIYDFVKVLDFGLVVHVDQTEAARLTAQGRIMGTVPYMAAEQLRDPLAIDIRSDIYALGSVAYTLLAGRPPFESEDYLSTIEAVLLSDPEPLSEAADQVIPAGLEAIIMRCLAKEAGDRYASTRELLAALEDVEDIDAWTQSHARRWWEQFLRQQDTG